jgi:hypothetical protein
MAPTVSFSLTMTLVIALRSGVEDAAALSVPGELMVSGILNGPRTRDKETMRRGKPADDSRRALTRSCLRLMGKRPCRRRALPRRETGCCGEIAVYGVTFFNYFKVFIYP